MAKTLTVRIKSIKKGKMFPVDGVCECPAVKITERQQKHIEKIIHYEFNHPTRFGSYSFHIRTARKICNYLNRRKPKKEKK